MNLKPHICYCQIPEDALQRIAKRRFVDGIETERLMEELKTDEERSYLAAIALLDVKPEDLPKIVPDNPALVRHLYDCRFHVLLILKEAGIEVATRS